MALTKAVLIATTGTGRFGFEVMFNPAELSIEQSVSYAEHPTLGASDPIIQFVRAEGQTTSFELFLDATNSNRSVAEDLAALRKFVEIDSELHAPPICELLWGDSYVRGVVKSLSEKYVLFGQDGGILRARVNVTLRRYQEPDIAAQQVNTHSPDRTRVRVMREGETLAHIAQEAYGDPRLWNVIAAANNIDRPRFIAPGTPLKVPAL